MKKLATDLGINFNGNLLEMLTINADISANVTLLSEKEDSYSDIVVSTFDKTRPTGLEAPAY